MTKKFVTRSGVVVSTSDAVAASVGYKPVGVKKPKQKPAAGKNQKKE